MFDFLAYEKALEDSPFFGRPFVLFMGPQRAGTSWIDRYLRARGDVCLPSQVKETFFFDEYWARGDAFYKNHFDLNAGHGVVSEVSATAFDVLQAPQRVHALLGGQVRLVCPLRHPVDRAYSLYQHFKRYGMVHGTLQEACVKMPRILNSSRYAVHLRNWLDYFPPESLHVLFQEDLEHDMDGYVRDLCVAVGVPYQDVPSSLRVKINGCTTACNRVLAFYAHKAAQFLRSCGRYDVVNFAKDIGLKSMVFGSEEKRSVSCDMSVEERQWLDERLGDEVEKLERLIGPIPQWRSNMQEIEQDIYDTPYASPMVRSSHTFTSRRAA